MLQAIRTKLLAQKARSSIFESPQLMTYVVFCTLTMVIYNAYSAIIVTTK